MIEEDSNHWIKTENKITFIKKKHRESLIKDKSNWILNIQVIEYYEFINIWEAEENCFQEPGKVINSKTKKQNKDKNKETSYLQEIFKGIGK